MLGVLFTCDDPVFYLNYLHFWSLFLKDFWASPESVNFRDLFGSNRLGFGEDSFVRVWLWLKSSFSVSQEWRLILLWVLQPWCSQSVSTTAWCPSTDITPAGQLPPPQGIMCIFHIYLPGLNNFTGKILIAPVWMNCNLSAVPSKHWFFWPCSQSGFGASRGIQPSCLSESARYSS